MTHFPVGEIRHDMTDSICDMLHDFQLCILARLFCVCEYTTRLIRPYVNYNVTLSHVNDSPPPLRSEYECAYLAVCCVLLQCVAELCLVDLSIV